MRKLAISRICILRPNLDIGRQFRALTSERVALLQRPRYWWKARILESKLLTVYPSVLFSRPKQHLAQTLPGAVVFGKFFHGTAD